ncbi:alpha/beta fold hydrolase [Pseudomonas syringae]|uniref:alpha/beta fold hydrolase n=1 Tax=Pseudomonas syringae TaxID=317 RepID=UPI0013043ACF|nr:alpha/beta fold hydrolase [Pseudomonas syringae]
MPGLLNCWRILIILMSLLMSDVPQASDSISHGIAVASKAQPAVPESLERRHFANGVLRLTDLSYASSADDHAMTLDLYLPPKPDAVRPLIVYVHGGGWSAGHSRVSGAFEDFPAVLANFAAQGYVVASVNYRLSGTAIYPAALDDLRAAMQWLQAHHEQYAIDVNRVALWGGSAGAQLAALAALDCSPQANIQKAGIKNPMCATVLVSWFGLFDFADVLGRPDFAAIDQAARQFLGCPGKPCPTQRVRDASPISHFADLPTLLIHGTADRVVPWQQSQQMASALERQQGQVELLLLPDVGHSFVGRDHAATQAANYRALQVTERFLADHL